MSGDPEQEYFSDGITEDIITDLSKISALSIVSRNTAFTFKGKTVELPQVAKQTKASYVLEGSVRKAGNRVRVTAQIVNVADGYHLWSETFDRDLADIFAVQDDIAKAVVQALKVKLLPGRAPPARALHATTPQVYEQYLQARQFYAQLTPEGFRRAAGAYERTIALDPLYAPAWSGLAIQLSNLTETASTPAEAANLERRSLEAAEKAIALDSELAEGYAARSLLRAIVNWDWRGAQLDMDRALSLAAGDSSTQRRSAILLAALGRYDEAIAAARKAIEIDPLFAANWKALGGYYMLTNQLVPARSAFERAREMAPQMEGIDFELGILALLEGQPALALASFERRPEELGHLQGVALAQHALHRPTEARRALDALMARHGARHPVLIGETYACRGELDRAFEWFDRAYARHDAELVQLEEHVVLAPKLRSDPRFTALLRKMNLPED
jgi:TolB-like protein